VFLAAHLSAGPASAATPPAGTSDSSLSRILVGFSSDPGFAIADRIDSSTGLRPVSSRVTSVGALLARYSASYSRQLFAGTRLQNVYELAIKGDSSLAIADLMKDPNVIYARLSDPGLEGQVAATIDEINSKTGGVWIAGYTIPGIMTPEDRRKLLGFSTRPERSTRESSAQQDADARFAAIAKSLSGAQAIALPASFDWRTYNNTNYITPVKNQGACGSCWAFADAGTVQDQADVWYNTDLKLDLSEQQMLSCSGAGTCVEGYADRALNYIQTTGLVSESCFPYAASSTVACSKMCSNPTYWKISSWSWLPTDSSGHVNDLSVQIGVLADGPFTNYLEIYSDFYNYVSGIYYPTSTVAEGGHFGVVVGYGFAAPPPVFNSTSSSVLYFSMKNSWGTSWGQSGFFKIFSGAASDDQWMESIHVPAPPSAQSAVCQDLDGAGHCYWGLGPKPESGCPSACTSATEYCAYYGASHTPVACLTNTSVIEPAITLTTSFSSIPYGASLPLTAAMAFQTVTPTGSVAFSDGSTLLGTAVLNASGLASYLATGLAGGSHSMTASYSGDANYSPETSPAVSVKVSKAAAAASLTASESSGTYGAPITLTATVTGPGAPPTGAVAFLNGTATLGTVTLSAGVATLSTSILALGKDSITAKYAGDGNYNTATSAAVTVTINKATQTIAFTAPASIAYGASPMKLAATATSGMAVTFSATGPATLSGNTLTITGVGSIVVTASQPGNASFSAATPVAQTIQVYPGVSTAALTSSAATFTFGSSVTLTAAVAGGGVRPTGTVTYFNGATSLGKGTLNASGVATLAIASLPVGSDSITANYGGDKNYAASESTAISVTVSKANPTIKLKSSATSIAAGSSVTITATLTGSGSAAPSGTVSFLDGANTLGTATPTSGAATYATSKLASGKHSITAKYGGDSNYLAATSDSVTVTVGK